MTSAQADSLSLADALALARARRGALAVAQAVVAEARAQKRIATAFPNPLVNYYHKESDPRQRLTIEQRFDWLLRWPSTRAAGLAAIERAEADSTQRVANVAREVRLAFYGALATRDLLRISVGLAAVADTLDQLASRRLEAGDISIVEKDRFTLESVRARRALSAAREAEQLALAGLIRATGWNQPQLPVLQGSLAANLDNLPDTTVAQLAATPLVKIAMKDSAQFARQLTSARLSMVPLPSLYGGPEWDNKSSPDNRATAIIGMTVPLPLWSQRREQSAEAAAQAQRRTADLSEARAEARRLYSEVKVRLNESSRRALIARDTLVPTAQRLRLQAVQLYQAGRMTVLDVFEALRVEREVSTTMIDDLLTYQRALADWYAFLGRYQ
jgi:cobalt-zinc-cadmium efflux system outer membrane protein